MAANVIQAGGGVLESSPEYLTVKLPKHGKAIKPFTLKEVGVNPDGTKVYEVPKNHLYGHLTQRLAGPDGREHLIQCNWTLPATPKERQDLYDAAIAAGLTVKPLEEPKPRRGRAMLTADALRAMARPAVDPMTVARPVEIELPE